MPTGVDTLLTQDTLLLSPPSVARYGFHLRRASAMFKRSFSSKDRVDKVTKSSKKSFSASSKQKLAEKLDGQRRGRLSSSIKGTVVTITVGKDQRLFAAHEDVLALSPYLTMICAKAFFDGNSKRIELPDEEPAVISAVLEYLYKGDYSPRLLHDKRRDRWYLEKLHDDLDPTPKDGAEAVIYHSGVGDFILRDTAVYCAAERYGIEQLKRLALRKQNLQSDLRVGTILRSCQFAYENTPDTDTAIRSHFLFTIIRGRKAFARSGTMQQMMELGGGKMWFDLFTAMCNHMDDLQSVRGAQSLTNTPKTV